MTFSVEILCSSRELFGADRAGLRLAAVLKRIGASVTLVVPSQRPEHGLAEAAAAAGVDYAAERLAIVSSRGVECIDSVLRPVRRRGRPNLSIVNSTAVLAPVRRGDRTIQMVREWLEPASTKHVVLGRAHAFRADRVIAVSNDVAAQWKAASRGADAVVINDWLDASDLDRAKAVRLEPASRDAQILCLGRFNQWKGQEVLAKAFMAAFGSTDKAQRPRLLFLGAQTEEPFKTRSDAVRDAGTGFWTVEEFTNAPEKFLRSAALVVVPSLHPEPFGLVVLEALAHGCRVLAFPGGGPADLSARLPGSISLVDRSVAALASGLTAWYQGGGGALTAAESVDTDAALRAMWSDDAAEQQWRYVLETLEVI